MANSTNNAAKSPPAGQHHVKRAIVDFLGVDVGDVTSMGIFTVILLSLKALYAPKPVGGVDTKGPVDEVLWRLVMTFFKNSGALGNQKLKRIGGNGMPLLEGNGVLIAEFVSGVSESFRKISPTLPVRFREYLFVLLFTAQNQTKEVTDWINRLIGEQTKLKTFRKRWEQIQDGDPTTQLFLSIARQVQAVITRDRLPENRWEEAYNEVAVKLLAEGDIKLPPQAQAAEQLKKWFGLAKLFLGSPDMAAALTQIEAWAGKQEQKIGEQNHVMGWVIIGLIIAILAMVFIGANMAPHKHTTLQAEDSK